MTGQLTEWGALRLRRSPLEFDISWRKMAHNFFIKIKRALASKHDLRVSQSFLTPFGSFIVRPLFIHLIAWGFVSVGLFNVLKSLDRYNFVFLFAPEWLAVLGSTLIAIGTIAHLGTLKKLARRTGSTFGVLALITWVLSSFLLSVTSVLSNADSFFYFLGSGFEGFAQIFLGLQFYVSMKALSNSSLKRKFYVRKM